MGSKRVAVIGAGPMGLGTMKTLKEESIEPVCFERINQIGGLWRYHDDDVDGLASVMKTTIINSSKEMSAISDFPPDEDAPNYMHNKLVFKYIEDYAKAFDLEKHVQFHKEVILVDLAADYDETGRLIVSVKDTKTQDVTTDTYDGVYVCIGHHVYPHIPSFPGVEKFKGKVMHTHSLKKVDQFEDQSVVVVGVGNSGMDAAVEISPVAKQVYLSTRRGTWVLPRVGPYGLPFDVALTRRYLDLVFQYLPYNWTCSLLEKYLNTRFNHRVYSLKPEHRVLSQHPTVSDGLPTKLISGAVEIKKNIKEFVENGVIFENERTVTKCDAVVLATGYNIKFPFLSEKLATTENNEVHLYKYVFPPQLKHPSLGILGLVQSVGAGFPVGEIQARWSTLVMNGKIQLPSRMEMENDIRKKKEVNRKRYTNSQRHTIQVDYIGYIDEIAQLIGAKPNFLKLFFTDPELFWTLMFGPSLPYQYRLQGPHSWPGARNAILQWKKRVLKPLNKDYKYSMRSRFSPFKILLLVLLFAVVYSIVINITF